MLSGKMTHEEQLHGEIVHLQNEIDNLRREKAGNVDLPNSDAAQQEVQRIPPNHPLKPRRYLTGHYGKIYAMGWCKNREDNVELMNRLVSASQDGHLFVWDTFEPDCFKLFQIKLKSPWVLAVGYSPNGRLVGAGGLDNTINIFPVHDENNFNPVSCASLLRHSGYLTSCEFLSNNSQLLSSAGDGLAILWDLERRRHIREFHGHYEDVMSVSMFDENTFVSGSVDTLCKVWDLRSGGCVQTHDGHESDINDVSVFPDGYAFGTASDDSSSRLFDLRCWNQLNTYTEESLVCGISSVAFSRSGRLIFSGCDDFVVRVWDTVTGRQLNPLAAHKGQITSVGMNSDGSAICSSSWDKTLIVWA